MAARGDEGSATVWAVALAALGCCVFAGVLGVGAAVTARHRAAAAADLAALAAALRLPLAPQAACGRAAWIAAEQRARVVACEVRTGSPDDSVTVETEARAAGPFAVLLPPARARARAGPWYAVVALPRASPPQVLSAPRRAGPVQAARNGRGPGPVRADSAAASARRTRAASGARLGGTRLEQHRPGRAAPRGPPPGGRPGRPRCVGWSGAEQHVEQPDGSGLVQGLVAVAALG